MASICANFASMRSDQKQYAKPTPPNPRENRGPRPHLHAPSTASHLISPLDRARERERRLGTEPRAAHAHGARARARLDSVPIDRSIARAAVQAPTATARPYLHCSPTPTWRAYHTIRRYARPHYWDDATLQATGPRVLKLTARIGFEKILKLFKQANESYVVRYWLRIAIEFD